MPRNTREPRTSVSCSLPPDLAARLHAESDARLVSPSLLLEKGIRLLFTSFDHPMPEGETGDIAGRTS